MWRMLMLFCVSTLIGACTGHKQKSNYKADVKMDSLFMLVGSYAPASEEGIKLYAFNELTGDGEYVSGLKGIENPSYLTVSGDASQVYAVGENDMVNSTANAVNVDLKSGHLSLLNTVSTQGAAPCYITLSPKEDFVLTANYNGGNLSIFRRDGEGKLVDPRVIGFVGSGVDPERQEKPHLHYIDFTPDRSFALAVDLGTDCLHVFPLNEQDNRVTAPFLDEDKPQHFMLPSGCGPRHLRFSADGRFAYIMTELSGEVLVLEYLQEKTRLIQRIAADTLGARGSADIHLSPDGAFLYASNRLKGDGIAIFKVDRLSGKLTKVGYQPTGVHPRNFAITPNGQYLLVACRDSNLIQVFHRDAVTGILKDTGKNLHTSQPTCLQFVRKQG